MRIICEARDEPLSFNDLQVRCDGMSSSVLSQRLGELREAGIIAQSVEGNYSLSEEGRNLLTIFAPLQEWAIRWAEREKKFEKTVT